MTATGTEDYVTEYNYNNAQGNYTALLQKEVKTVECEENSLELNSNVKQTVYTYDANGNQIKKTAEGKTETNTYDGLNQLIGFTDGETTASYKYNASGLRYEKTVDGQTINHVWEGNKQIVADVIYNQFYEADCYIRGTNLVAKYNYWNGDKSEYTYYTQNAHGDVVNLTDKDGKVTKSYRYDAFGVEKNIDNSDTNAFRYCGEYYDKETATIYLRARYYNPNTGRFISRDSYAGRRTDPLSLNLYTYCRNNPIRYIDPSGHSYAVLPNGKRMSINSASDVKQFNSARDRLSVKIPMTSSSQVKTTTAPTSEATPITGGLATQTTTTTISTTALTLEKYEALQKKDTSFFSKICTGAKSLFCSIFGYEYSYIMENDRGGKILPYNSPINAKYVSKYTEVINQIGDSSKPISVYFQTVDSRTDSHSSAGIKLNLFGFSANLRLGVENTGISISYTNDDTTSYFGYGASFENLSINCNTGITEAYSDTGSYTNGGEASINAMLAYELYCYFQGIPYIPSSEQYETVKAN